MESTSSGPAWFGTFELAVNETRSWRIGPLRLHLLRAAREWQATRVRGDDSPADGLWIAEPPRTEADGPGEITRFGYRRSPERVRLVPRLADRPMVVDTARPFVLPPQEEVTLYLSTPLWLQIELGGAPVLEEPILRPSDTWFGPNTQVGELCYASMTSARLDLANLPVRPHRAVTAVLICNHALTKVELKSLKFPMPHLSLFANEAGALWTQTLTLDRERDDDDANVLLGKTPPDEAGRVTLVADARQTVHKNFLTRAFGGLLDLGR